VSEPGGFGEKSVENRSRQIQAAPDEKSLPPPDLAGVSKRPIIKIIILYQ
jgi:hypothetical protein